MSIDRASLLAYQRRWQAVNEVRQAEQQAATIAERWQRLNALLRLAGSLGLQSPEPHPMNDPAQQRWNHLRALYLGEREESLS